LLHTAKYSCNRDLRYGRSQKATKMISTGQLGLLKKLAVSLSSDLFVPSLPSSVNFRCLNS
jgi:hypothetical protein